MKRCLHNRDMGLLPGKYHNTTFNQYILKFVEKFQRNRLYEKHQKTILKNLTVKTGEKRRSQRYIFRGWQPTVTYFDF